MDELKTYVMVGDTLAVEGEMFIVIRAPKPTERGVQTITLRRMKPTVHFARATKSKPSK